MTTIDPAVVRKFCDICRWVYDCWQFHRTLFDDNPHLKLLREGKQGFPLDHLGAMTQEYVLHEMAKLHDNADFERKGKQKDHNIGYAYIVENGNWDAQTRVELERIHDRLKKLGDEMGLVQTRNKILSHNDLATHMNRAVVGQFAKGLDIEYFDALKEFVGLVHEKTVGGPYSIEGFGKFDAEILLTALVNDSSPDASEIDTEYVASWKESPA